MQTKVFFTVPETCHVLGIRTTHCYALLKDGQLAGVLSGRRRLITAESITAYADSLLKAAS